MSLDYLNDLNGLGRGVNKHWIYKDRLHQELAHDYLQKICFSIQDINDLIGDSGRIEKRTDVISLIAMVDWIASSVWEYKGCLLAALKNTFKYSKHDELKKCFDFLKSIRSIVVAHPLSTDQHASYGYDGDIICVDLRVSQPFDFESRSNVRRVGITGKEPYENEHADDVYLYVYSKKKNAEFFEFHVIDLVDVVCVAQLYIDQIYEIDKYLSKLRKMDFAAK